MTIRLPRRQFLATLLAAPAAGTAAAAAATPAAAGVFNGGGQRLTPDPIAVRMNKYDSWLYGGSRSTPLFIDFAAHSSWAEASSSLGFANFWAELCPPGRLILAWPLATAAKPGKAGFAEIVAGGQDALLARLCSVLTSRGLNNTIIRLGWEMNGDWYPWSAAADPAGYIAAYRHVVQFCRGQRGVDFRWCWNPNIGKNAIAWEACYPGYYYVDYIGVDIYDMYWGSPAIWPQSARWRVALENPYGLQDIAAFAKAKQKALTIPEWSVGMAAPVGGGVENPAWVDYMADFIADPANNVAWHCYWNGGSGSGYDGRIYPTDLRPQTAARYKARFGA